ncbi:MAG: GNAT family N-acetyltransferase [Planctomycetota bacterium]|nr:MAG: GNAT family N-acetyltransferase [Planctomycetota bacterium]
MSDHSSSSLHLRPATPDDAEVLAQLVADLAVYEGLGADNRCTAEALRAELSSSDHALEAIVAELDGRIVGMATFFQTYSTFAARRGLYLEDIYVVSDCRHRGIGTAILRHIAWLARERGYGRVEWTTLLWNTPAIEFYEKLGAKPNDAWTTYRLSGEWMERLAREEF